MKTSTLYSVAAGAAIGLVGGGDPSIGGRLTSGLIGAGIGFAVNRVLSKSKLSTECARSKKHLEIDRRFREQCQEILSQKGTKSKACARAIKYVKESERAVAQACSRRA